MGGDVDKKEIFEFIKANLSLVIDEDYGRDYGRVGCGLSNYKSFRFNLNLTNPETGKDETISSQSFSIDLE